MSVGALGMSEPARSREAERAEREAQGSAPWGAAGCQALGRARRSPAGCRPWVLPEDGA